jgi:carbon-monoxide dehydrogenase medium subunit
MYRYLKEFEYHEPQTIEETIQVLSTQGATSKVIAGGTDVVVSMRKRRISPRRVVSIARVRDLDYIHFSQAEGLKIGALATHRSLAESPIVKEKYEILATACAQVGTPQIRNTGTIGGNVCMAGPSQDTPPALLALNASLKCVSIKGERLIPIDEFFVAPFETALDQTELLTEIQVPSPSPESAGVYKWLTKMTGLDETLVGVAVLMSADSEKETCEDIRIGLCSVAPTPFRAKRAEALLRGRKVDDELIENAAGVAAEETKPRSRSGYRRSMAGVLVKRAINETWERISCVGAFNGR